MATPHLRIPDGTSHYLSDLLIKLLKKNPKDRLSYGKLPRTHTKIVVLIKPLRGLPFLFPFSFPDDFFQHNFLKDPSCFSSGNLRPVILSIPLGMVYSMLLCRSLDPMLTFHPSQTVKSSPVPIKRKPNPQHSSPHLSVSPVIIIYTLHIHSGS